jgi:hypothetical protein
MVLFYVLLDYFVSHKAETLDNKTEQHYRVAGQKPLNLTKRVPERRK